MTEPVIQGEVNPSPNASYRGNLAILKLGYDIKIVTTIETISKILALLNDAEMVKEISYSSDNFTVEPMNLDISVKIIARSKYELAKLAFLRKVDNESD